MTASQRRTVIVSVAALGVAIMLVWAATTGPVGVVGGSSGTRTVDATAVTTPPSPAHQAPSRDKEPTSDRASPASGSVGDVVGYATVLAGLWLLTVVLRSLLVRLARDLPEKQLVLDLDPLPDVAAGREALERDHGLHHAALETADIRNGIVACWVLLEAAAAEAGVTRLPAETATEFVVRFLHALDVDPRPVAALAGLYHEARFSTHTMPSDSRRRAEQALAGIHLDLDRSPAP